MNANSFMASGVDNAFSLDDFKSRFSIEVTSLGAPPRPAAAAGLYTTRLRRRASCFV
jgi:hypothetical protein